MRIVMISNYLTHHQIPFCDAMCRLVSEMGDGSSFLFLQTEPMEEERKAMGWKNGDDRSYLRPVYEDEENCRSLLREAEVVLYGGTERKEYLRERMEKGNPEGVTFVYSERLYREGQWKFITPRGLIDKYHLYTKHRKKRMYLMCAGSFVASDFALVHAFPDKKYKWGYFPEFIELDYESIIDRKEIRLQNTGILELLWVGRFMPLKHAEYALRLVHELNAEAMRTASASQGNPRTYLSSISDLKRVHLTLIGGGETEEMLRGLVKEYGIEEDVTFTGFLDPEEVRRRMLEADVHLFTSNHLEGWGAVVNEAMNACCIEISSHMAGVTGFVLKHKENGYVFRSEDYEDLRRNVEASVANESIRRALRQKAYLTIRDRWNANTAAERFLKAAKSALAGEKPAYEADGPMSCAEAISPGRMYRHLV